MPVLELPQLDLRYAGLRIADPTRRARLEQALAREGQQVPILVIAGDADKYVLIEGYGRVDALKRLARDTVLATLLDMGEAEALVLRHRLDHGAPRSALEEGWLVTTLLDCGKSQVEVAIALAKSTAWVSRRLALVRTRCAWDESGLTRQRSAWCRWRAPTRRSARSWWRDCAP